MLRWLLPAVLAGAALTVSCVKEQVQEPSDALMADMPVLTATTSAGSPATKASLDASGQEKLVVWDKGDAISVFYHNTTALKYALEGEGGSPKGNFLYASGFSAAFMFPEIYAAYPYDKATKFDGAAFTLKFPAEQNYTEGGFDPKANLMVAATSGEELYFRNVGGYLVIPMYGEEVSVEKVEVTGCDGEPLAGLAEVYAYEDDTPDTWLEGETSETVTLTADPAVAVGASADAATEFWFVLPPTDFYEGLTVKVTDTEGNVYEATADVYVGVERNAVFRLAPLELSLQAGPGSNDPIEFKDQDLKAHLVECGVDTDGDGEISYAEAAAVTSFEGFFDGNTDETGASLGYPFTSFDEFQYFTGITRIRSGQFVNWTGMTSIRLPEGLEEIPAGAFSGCTSLKTIVIPENAGAIGGGAFGGCEALAGTLTIPGNVKTVSSSAFYGCSSLEAIIFEDGVNNVSYCFGGNGSLEKIEFAGTITSLPSGLCAGLASLKEVTLGDGIEALGDGVFASTGLENVTVPGSVKTVGGGAFSNCAHLKSVVFEEGVTTVGSCFGGSSVEKIVFPGTVKSLPSGLCAGISSLKEVTLGDGIEEIGSGAFYECTSLEEIAIPGSVKTVNTSVFGCCSSLKKATIGEGVEYLSSAVFYNCTSLTEIDIPGSVKEINTACFQGCAQLSKVTMHAGTEKIGNVVFASTAIESFTFPGTVKQVVASVFGGCTKLQSVDLAGVEILDSGSFAGLASLTSVTMHEGLKTIYQAFSGTGLTSVVIPASVTYLGGGAFADCPLTSATFLGTTPPDGSYDAFSGTTCPIYVPASALETYKTSSVWSPLADRFAAAP